MNNNKKTIIAGFVAALISTSALAGGLERQTYSADILFAKGTRIEAAFGTVKPDVTGSTAFSPYTGGGINPDYDLRDFGVKFDISDQLSLALTGYSPLGYSLSYPDALPRLAIQADVKSQAYALSAKYMVKDNIAVFGSAIHIQTSAILENLTAGVKVDASGDSDWGYVIGAAYLKPEIALRIAASYETGTDHSHSSTFNGSSFLAPGVPVPNSQSSTARAIALNFQTGIAANTLLFGGIRHAYHSDAQVFVNNKQITSFENETTYKIGIGRKINDFLSLSVSGLYEHGSGKVSTLNPTNGKFTLSGGAKFQLTEYMDLSAGVSRTWLGDNTTNPAQTGVAIPFSGNSALAFGAKIGFSF